MRRLVVVLCVVLVGISATSMASASAGPRGSVVLKSSALLNVGSTQCGKVDGSWVSGKVTKIKSKNYFVSYVKSSQLYSADAKKSQGLQKRKLLKLASDYKAKASLGDKKCSRYNVSIPISTTVPFTSIEPESTTVPITSTVPLTSSTTVPLVSQALKFDVRAAVALALVDPSVTSSGIRKRAVGSNLQTIDVDGETKDAVVGGVATISRFLIAPNDLLYVQFYPAVTVGESSCVLAQISKSSGDPVCIERDSGFIFVPPGQSELGFGTTRPLVNDFQFDAEGAIYYLGIPSDWKRKFPSASHFGIHSTVQYCWDFCNEGSVVRKVKDGVVTDFGNASFELGTEMDDWFAGQSTRNEIYIHRAIANFLVLADGRVLTFSASEKLWAEKCPNPGTCEIWPYSLELWSSPGVKRTIFDSTSGVPVSGNSVGFLKQVDSKHLLAGMDYSTLKFDLVNFLPERFLGTGKPELFEGLINKFFECQGVTSSWFDYKNYYCLASSSWRTSWVTPNGDVYALSGNDKFRGIENYENHFAYKDWVQMGALYGSGIIYRTWPNVETTRLGKPELDTDLVRVEAHAFALGKIFAFGPDAQGRKHLFSYDTVSKEILELIPSNSGIQINSLSFSSRYNSLFFVGVRSSTKESVTGKVDLGDLKLLVVKSSIKISGLQGFKS